MNLRDRLENETAPGKGPLRIRFLGVLARLLGVQFKYGGLPYGGQSGPIATTGEQDRSANCRIQT
jgi:hypothetical protein